MNLFPSHADNKVLPTHAKVSQVTVLYQYSSVAMVASTGLLRDVVLLAYLYK